jgi:transposase
MNYRRLAGIDLGIATAHTVRVLDGEGGTVAKRKAWPTVESLTMVEAAALAGCPAGTRLEVVIEPTGPAWLPIAVFFSTRGHQVFRVSSQKAADLRRFLSRHAKSNGIDADTLARLPLSGPAGLRPLVLPGAERAALDRRVRATDRLTRQAAKHKVRIRDLARQLLPLSPLTGDLGAADLAVLERYADPRALARAGQARLTALIAKASHNHQGAERARQWLEAAHASLALYGGHPAIDFPGLAAEIATEVRLLRAICAELAAHAAEHERCYRAVDPAGLARTLPGFAEVGGPALAACMGDPARFGHGKKFRSFTGLAPKRQRPGKPTARASPCPRPDPRCCAPPWSAPPITPANKTPNSPASTTSRWPNEAKTTSAHSASSPPTSPNGPGPSCAAAPPTPSATPTAARSPQNKPRPPSPNAGPCPPRSAPAGAARRGRPPRKSSKDDTHGATSPQHTTPPRRDQSVKRNP